KYGRPPRRPPIPRRRRSSRLRGTALRGPVPSRIHPASCMTIRPLRATHPVLALAVAALAACTAQPHMTDTDTLPQAAAFDVAGMDTSVRPCDDFDRFANGGWKDNNPVPATESRWGAFGILAKENLE